eukprot:TRINITY_DN8118_c0_g1_i1.p1 TRINITY_DN8118_c0_g1~~TRINITY_DN8118_c0_g1_i1.p1  ORF type:complete len:346 (-),score=70.82 TRINITY_DN8118_c0_g1_i1:57-1094(-)
MNSNNENNNGINGIVNAINLGVIDFDKSKLKETTTVVKTRMDFFQEPEDDNSVRLDSFRFDVVKKYWYKEVRENDHNMESIYLNEIKCLTLNVWFAMKMIGDRTFKQIEEIQNLDPDFVLLQEMTWSSLKIYLKNPYIRNTFYISDINASTFDSGYGVVILSKHYIKFRMLRLMSYMGRNLIRGDLVINDEPFAISSIHLESLSYRDIRKTQLDAIYDILDKYPHSCLTGDFNFDSKRNFNLSDTRPLENIYLLEKYNDYIDVWGHLKPDDEGYTFDTEKNVMLEDHKFEQMRYDRIMLKSNKWIPDSIEIIGDEPFGINKNLHLSDHFGLFSIFKQQQQENGIN